MPRIFNFQVQNMPSTPVEQYGSSDDSPNSLLMGPSTPSSYQSSPGSFDSGSRVSSSRWPNRRRRAQQNKGTPRNMEMRPYHAPTHVSPPHDAPMTKDDIYFALDCEMVGIGPEGLDSAVARVTICNWAEKVVLDTFVKVPIEVTDYRTFVSGIEAKDLESDRALSLDQVREMVKTILHGKILIGHALENDLAALQITHPWHDIRDSATYPPFMKESESDKTVLRPRKLKELVKDKIGTDIQDLGKAHDPIEDARAALSLYKLERMQWEKLAMKQVAVARVKEGREREPSSGRDSPPNKSGGGYQQPSSVTPVPAAAIRPTVHAPSPSMGPTLSYTQPYPMYLRSQSAPMTMMTHHQGYEHRPYGHHHRQAYYPQQQHNLY